MKRVKWTGETLVNLAFLLLSAFYLIYALTHYDIGAARMPKAGFMPMLLGIGAVAISGFLTAKSLLGQGDARDVRLSLNWPRFLAMIAVSALYAAVLVPVGYLIATVAFLFAIFKLARLPGYSKPLIIAVATSAVFYLIFKVALGVPLPAGVLPL